MKNFYNLIHYAIEHGQQRGDRTGTGTRSVFGGQLVFDLSKSFPLVTFKETKFRSAFIEMLWFLRGEPNLKFLHEHNVHIWDEWADKDGNLGPIYGVQWRKWPGALKEVKFDDCHGQEYSYEDFVGIRENRTEDGQQVRLYQTYTDQVRELIHMLKTNPEGRRHIVTAWNPAYIKQMGLPPCHRDFQCYVTNDGGLDLMMSIRSWDLGLGGSFNIAQYALLTHLIARAAGLKANRLLINYGDAHVYANHVEPLRKHMAEHGPIDCSPQLIIDTDNTDIDGYKIDDFSITDYKSGPFLKLPIAV